MTTDRFLSTRSHCNAMVALDTVDALAERVVNLLSHGRRITLCRRYVDRNGTPEVYAGLTPSQDPNVWNRGGTAGFGVRLDQPGRLHAFGFSAQAGVNDTEEGEWKRYHAGDRVDMTEVIVTGGMPGDSPARDDLLEIRHWNSNGVCEEIVVAFDTDESQW